ncbi:uncharacterized protein LOC118645667 [Monomorium pharaonis]|uniref:uncharacterized protein LOC118645667 n=1 Tax=Monomorium pharaonis TaxID=307658 RepID=UPI001745F0B1|nr:uncharacterized protein LOC118645667 [Monomorium pharaonis]
MRQKLRAVFSIIDRELIMSITTFVDLQGFIVGRKFIVKEFTAFRDGFILSHYIFRNPVPWHRLNNADKRQASWLLTHHHGLRWNSGTIPYSRAKKLITTTLTRNETPPVIYVKGHEKREWLRNLLLDDTKEDIYVENIEAHYDDIRSLNEMDVTHTLRCAHHSTNCALQNVFKIFNWWHCHQ